MCAECVLYRWYDYDRTQFTDTLPKNRYGPKSAKYATGPDLNTGFDAAVRLIIQSIKKRVVQKFFWGKKGGKPGEN